MQIVIDANDFQNLSEAAQAELLEIFTKGRPVNKTAAKTAAKPAAQSSPVKETEGLRWREPVDLTLEQCSLLANGMTKKQLDILKAFANKSGRTTMKKLLETTGEKDLRGISKFQGLATRHLRHIIEDPQYKAMLFAWDFDKTKWDKGKTNIVDGEYYVSAKTADALRRYFAPQA